MTYKGKLYTITSSPFPEDNDLPWKYSEESFLDWVWEVFQEGYKREVPFLTADEAVDLVRNLDYGIEIEQEKT